MIRFLGDDWEMKAYIVSGQILISYQTRLHVLNFLELVNYIFCIISKQNQTVGSDPTPSSWEAVNRTTKGTSFLKTQVDFTKAFFTFRQSYLWKKLQLVAIDLMINVTHIYLLGPDEIWPFLPGDIIYRLG